MKDLALIIRKYFFRQFSRMIGEFLTRFEFCRGWIRFLGLGLRF